MEYEDMNLDKLTPEELKRLGRVTAMELFTCKNPKDRPKLKPYLLEIALTHWEKTRGENHGTE